MFGPLNGPRYRSCHLRGQKSLGVPQKVSILCLDHLESLNWPHLVIWQGTIHNTTPHLQHRCINSYQERPTNFCPPSQKNTITFPHIDLDAQRAVYEQGPLPLHPEHRAGSGCAAKCRACAPGMDTWINLEKRIWKGWMGGQRGLNPPFPPPTTTTLSTNWFPIKVISGVVEPEPEPGP